MRLQRRALPERLRVFIKLEARLLEVLDPPVGELLTGIVGHVLGQDPPEQTAAAADRQADRECQVLAEVHGWRSRRSCFVRSTLARDSRHVKPAPAGPGRARASGIALFGAGE
jgi:hypothetical protein